jgi:hypothetical protein
LIFAGTPAVAGISAARGKAMRTSRGLTAALSAAAAGALLLTGAGIAAAASSSPPQHAARAAVSRTSAKVPCLTLWAVVNKAGHLERAGCPGTSSKYIGTGYQVLFSRNVRDCAYVATTGNAGSQDVPSPAIATVAGREGHVNGVFISTVNLAGNPIQRGFHLIVECKQPHL